MTLTGSGFQAGTQVLFGSTPATGVSVNAGGTELTATTPPHALPARSTCRCRPRAVPPRSPAASAYVAAPTLTAVAPDAGPLAGGTAVTLTGSGFRAGMQVRSAASSATGVSVNPGGTQLTALAPAHSAGGVNVSVTTPGGSAALGNSYTYLAAPAATSLSPTEGPTAGGTAVTVNGSGFRVGMEVRFGGVLASVVSINPAGTVLTATSPAHVAGHVDVSVTTPGGTDRLAGAFTYVVTPTVGAVSPAEGPTTGGTTVTLTGTGFRAGMQVRFGGVPAAAVSIDPGGTALTATSPAHGAGAVDVSVTTSGGEDTLPNAYTYVAAPTLTAANPSSGPAAGGTTLTLTGTGFRAGMQVSVGGTPAAIVSIDPGGTSATATTAAHTPGLVGVSVTTPGGSDVLASSFTYVAVPTLTSVTPAEGPDAGGTTITLTGTRLTGTAAVTLGGVPATDVVVVDDSTVTATTPAHAAGAVDVSVTTPGGTGTPTSAFAYVAAPDVSSVSPADGPAAGGTAVTLTGAGLTGATAVTFDGTTAADLVVVDEGTVTVTSPAHATGVVDVSVTTPGGPATATGSFTYLP